MNRNKQSKKSLDTFMGGYNNEWSNMVPSGYAAPTMAPSEFTDRFATTVVSAPPSVPLTPMEKLKLFRGDGNKVRLFEHCTKDSAFGNGWIDEITPKSNGTVRMRLGYKGTTVNDSVSAIYIPSGYDVVLHEHARSDSKFQSGKHKILRKSDACLSSSWNDMVTEIDIIPQAGFLTSLVKPWQSQVNDHPVQTIGNYPGQTSTSSGWLGGILNSGNWTPTTNTTNRNEWCFSCGAGGVGIKAKKMDECDEITWFKNKDDAGCRGYTGTQNTVYNVNSPNYVPPEPIPAGTNMATSTNPNSGSNSGSSSGYDYNLNNPNSAPLPAAPVVAPVVAPARAPLMLPEEEDGMLSNPLVWGAIALVVVGIGYLMTDTKKVATAKAVVVPSTATPSSGRVK